MEDNKSLGCAEGSCAYKARTLPRWNELPDFGLYMDQVISLMERYLGPPVAPGERGLTASMVNNYVKIGAVPSPQKKKYGRPHLACLIVVCALKPVLPLETIRQILSKRLAENTLEETYGVFCDYFEEAERSALELIESLSKTSEPQNAIVVSALNAHAQRNAALAYLMQSDSGE